MHGILVSGQETCPSCALIAPYILPFIVWLFFVLLWCGIFHAIYRLATGKEVSFGKRLRGWLVPVAFFILASMGVCSFSVNHFPSRLSLWSLSWTAVCTVVIYTLTVFFTGRKSSKRGKS